MRTEYLRSSLLQVEVQAGNMCLFSAAYVIALGIKSVPALTRLMV